MDKSAPPAKRKSRLIPTVRAALLLTLALSIAPALAVIVWSGIEYGTHLTTQARQEAQRQADSFAEIQTRITESAEQMLATLAALPVLRTGDAQAILPVLSSAHSVNPGYINLAFEDDAGFVVASPRLAPGVNLSEREHVRKALSEKRFSAGEYIRNLVDDRPSVAYTYPVFGPDGVLRGVLSATIALDCYGPLFHRLDLPNDSFPSDIVGSIGRHAI